MSEIEVYEKTGEPDRLVSNVAAKVKAEFDGYKLKAEDKPAKKAEAKQ